MRAILIIPDEIREFISYDPKTGYLYRIKSTNPKRPKLKLGFPLSNKDTTGSVQCPFKGTNYLGHRVAYFLMTGQQPNVIDHINFIRDDNRWCNLRNVTKLENCSHLKKHQTGVPIGISFDITRNKFKVRLTKLTTGLDKAINIGSYKTIEESIEAYDLAAKLYKKFSLSVCA